MSLCLAAAAVAISLGVDTFTLTWTHSVEKTEWREDWRVHGRTLVLEEARVRGSGAGMEPPDGAVLRDGWWLYHADLKLPVLRLAASGATGRGWQFCAAGGCRDLEAALSLGGQAPEAIEISPATTTCRPLGRGADRAPTPVSVGRWPGTRARTASSAPVPTGCGRRRPPAA